MWITWLNFGAEFSSDWHSFQTESTTGGTIAEVLGDYLQQCEDFGSQPFIEPKIFNALSAEMIELEMQKH
jgi:hypothetical protein